MRQPFYDSEEYKEKQRRITRANAEKGVYAALRRRETRTCARNGCIALFTVKMADPKKFCSHSCSAKITNANRRLSAETRQKISKSMRSLPSSKKDYISRKGIIRVPREFRKCPNAWCDITFEVERWKKKTYCSAACAAKRPTSPKASRGKSGIRADISSDINFHSRWEANMARMYTYLGIEWKYEPVTFDIGGHTYTPDFYLPRYDEFIEVKNFWNDYAAKRDAQFRKTNPSIYLRLLLRDEYAALQELYGKVIPHWEFSR